MGPRGAAALLDADAAHDRAFDDVIRSFERAVAERIDIKEVALDHFSCMLDVRDRQTGEDLYPRLKEAVRAEGGSLEPLTRDMLRLTGCLPVPEDTHMSEYLPYTHDPQTKPWSATICTV